MLLANDRYLLSETSFPSRLAMIVSVAYLFGVVRQIIFALASFIFINFFN